MSLKTWTKALLILFALLSLSAWAFQADSWARVGRGRSFGSRGSRSFSTPKPFTAPRRPSSSSSSTRSTAPAPGTAAGTSSSGGLMRSFGGGLLGGLAGGMLFRSLFGGSGTSTGGGLSLLDILLLAGIVYLIYRYFRKRRQATEATTGYYQSGGAATLPPQPQYAPVYDQPQVAGPASDEDLERGLANIRQFDPGFDEDQFRDLGMDTFFKIQGAWANRDMSSVKTLLTDEMSRTLQQEADQLKAQKQINRLENIAVRSVDITEAWQESGADFITARIYASLLDYNVDETSGQVVDGSKTDPVKFEEYWTFTRPVGNNPWQLAAIHQA
jgi:predicted lipid-binding transport protein (Tim44 family)